MGEGRVGSSIDPQGSYAIDGALGGSKHIRFHCRLAGAKTMRPYSKLLEPQIEDVQDRSQVLVVEDMDTSTRRHDHEMESSTMIEEEDPPKGKPKMKST